MQRMVALLLAERVPADGAVLILGAGERPRAEAFGRAAARLALLRWFDPSAEMLEPGQADGRTGGRARRFPSRLCRHRAGGAVRRRERRFSPCTSSPKHERRRTLAEVRRRLKPGAPFIVVHHSIPEVERTAWLNRYAAFAISSGIDADHARTAISAIGQRLPLLSPDQDEAVLRDAGFEDIALFYAGFTFRGWVAYRGPAE